MQQNKNVKSTVSFFATTVLAGIAILLAIIIISSSSAHAQEQTTPIIIGSGTLPLDQSISVIAGSDQSANQQLAHENTMAIIDTSMRLGVNCTLLAVQKNAKKSKKPISLKELHKQADACIKENMLMIENRK